MTAVDTLLDRAGDLKGELLAFSEQRRFDPEFRRMLARHAEDAAALDEVSLMLLWDSFVLEHRLRDGRTVVEQFVDRRGDLPLHEREMLLGWRDVVSGVFELERRVGDALELVNLVDDLTYLARATAGPSVFHSVPKGSFLIARLVAVGDGWTFSGPSTVLRKRDRDRAVHVALEIALRRPEAVYRNPDRLAQAWQLQREDRECFIRFFGADLVVVPGGQAQRRLDDFSSFRLEEVLRAHPEARRRGSAPMPELPPELVGCDTVAFIYDEDDGLDFLAEFGLAEQAFDDPGLLRLRRYRAQVLSYLRDDSVAPMVLRRLAGRDTDKANEVFRRVLNKPRFDWARDGERLLRSAKADYFARPCLPTVTPVGERLAAYARR